MRLDTYESSCYFFFSGYDGNRGKYEVNKNISTTGTPIVITKDLKSFNIAFQMSEGMTIWENIATPPIINMGSGPFQAIITTTDY